MPTSSQAHRLIEDISTYSVDEPSAVRHRRSSGEEFELNEETFFEHLHVETEFLTSDILKYASLSSKPSVYVVGHRGTGKSVLLHHAARRLRAMGVPTILVCLKHAAASMAEDMAKPGLTKAEPIGKLYRLIDHEIHRYRNSPECDAKIQSLTDEDIAYILIEHHDRVDPFGPHTRILRRIFDQYRQYISRQEPPAISYPDWIRTYFAPHPSSADLVRSIAENLQHHDLLLAFQISTGKTPCVMIDNLDVFANLMEISIFREASRHVLATLRAYCHPIAAVRPNNFDEDVRPTDTDTHTINLRSAARDLGTYPTITVYIDDYIDLKHGHRLIDVRDHIPLDSGELEGADDDISSDLSIDHQILERRLSLATFIAGDDEGASVLKTLGKLVMEDKRISSLISELSNFDRRSQNIFVSNFIEYVIDYFPELTDVLSKAAGLGGTSAETIDKVLEDIYSPKDRRSLKRPWFLQSGTVVERVVIYHLVHCYIVLSAVHARSALFNVKLNSPLLTVDRWKSSQQAIESMHEHFVLAYIHAKTADGSKYFGRRFTSFMALARTCHQLGLADMEAIKSYCESASDSQSRGWLFMLKSAASDSFDESSEFSILPRGRLVIERLSRRYSYILALIMIEKSRNISEASEKIRSVDPSGSDALSLFYNLAVELARIDRLAAHELAKLVKQTNLTADSVEDGEAEGHHDIHLANESLSLRSTFWMPPVTRLNRVNEGRPYFVNVADAAIGYLESIQVATKNPAIVAAIRKLRDEVIAEYKGKGFVVSRL